MTVSSITEWLRKHGEAYNDGTAFTLNVKEEPWMEFNAELQDWSHAQTGKEILLIGYYFEQNGDMCPDPELKIDLQDGKITRIGFINWIGGAHDATNDSYATDFLDLVWRRHFEGRPVPMHASNGERSGADS